MKIYNTLKRDIQDFKPLHGKQVRMYSCGPTVYDHIHIGNLSSFIAADTLRRTLTASGYDVQHVMNFTDVDDKTIRRSAERFPDLAPEEALQRLTREYEQIFLGDMQAIGNDINAMQFVRATDSIDGIRHLITQLHKEGFAYIADDGVYFSIEKYRKSGKTYGQLLHLDASNTSEARIQNDEYDKESAHDFALWKTRKGDEPAWEFELEGHDLLGRPGWHIECSVMSADNLQSGQPFDIHTGGIDLIFPHHENEIAQSTAGKSDPMYAKYFFHNEHLLVDGKKMAKSAQNFFTLQDVRERGYDPLAFRLLVLQSYYRSQSNFTWENLTAAQNRLRSLRALADLRFQVREDADQITHYDDYTKAIHDNLENDLNTPGALASLSSLFDDKNQVVSPQTSSEFLHLLELIDQVFGLNLLGSQDISEKQKHTLTQRQQARDAKDWARSDQFRDKLAEQGIALRDTASGQIWHRV